MNVSVVIPTWNRAEFVGKTALSVLEGTYPDVEVRVVDQSENDATGAVVRALAERHPNLKYVHTTARGASRAYNTSARETEADVLAYIDDDCIAAPDWLERIVGALRSDPDVGMIYGQVLGPSDVAPGAGQPFLPQLVFSQPERIRRGTTFRVVGMNANSAVRRPLFERVGGFDEMLGPGAPLQGAGQDFDFQYRVCRLGATVLLHPDVKVEHYGARSHPQWGSSIRSYGRGDGAFYFKHVRCGDAFALSLLTRLVGRLLVREALEPIRRKYSQAFYIRALFSGIRDSLRYPIDRRYRLYLPRPEGPRSALRP